MNSERSSSGKNAVPTRRTAGTRFGTQGTTYTISPATTSALRTGRRNPLYVMPNTSSAIPATAIASPLKPFTGRRNEAKKLSTAIDTIAAR
jgi:hypothetical protein